MPGQTRNWISRCVVTLFRRLLPVTVICLWTFGLVQFPSGTRAAEAEKPKGDASEEDETSDLREERLDEMRQRAQATKLHRLDEGKRIPVNMLPEPVFRYSDQPRSILDATLWAWGTQGRPAALMKIESYRWAGGRWLYCRTSLSEGSLEAEWPDRRWSSKKPGLDLRQFPDGPAPSDSESRRLLQIKGMARRFASTASDPPMNWQEEQRLLTRPVYRYSDPDSGLLDGAIFAFTTKGTNPDLLLAIELHGQDLTNSLWKYGLQRMTNAGLSVRIDQKEVWSAPHRWPEKTFDTWLYFFETGATRR